jgi:hypothetical protein
MDAVVMDVVIMVGGTGAMMVMDAMVVEEAVRAQDPVSAVITSIATAASGH